MKRVLICLVIISVSIVLFSSNTNDYILVLENEALDAFDYLNEIRGNPAAFSDEIGISLSYVKNRDNLVWNEMLAQAAVEKAADMAGREYFAHVDPDGYGMNYHINKAGYELRADWLNPKSGNFFESIYYEFGINEAGEGRRAVKSLILDKNTNPPGHRNHLLGIEDFWADCRDCGIGIVRTGSKVYVSILIARHDFQPSGFLQSRKVIRNIQGYS